MKVLFVCLGNICRSPLAEAIFNHKAKNLQLSKNILADSCGTASYHIGDPPDHRTIKVATDHNVHIDHVGRQLSIKDFEDFDLILAMDEDNLRNILRVMPDQTHEAKVKLMRDYDPNGKGAVPDPYYGDASDFLNVYNILDRSIDQLIKEITSS